MFHTNIGGIEVNGTHRLSVKNLLSHSDSKLSTCSWPQPRVPLQHQDVAQRISRLWYKAGSPRVRLSRYTTGVVNTTDNESRVLSTVCDGVTAALCRQHETDNGRTERRRQPTHIWLLRRASKKVLICCRIFLRPTRTATPTNAMFYHSCGSLK